MKSIMLKRGSGGFVNVFEGKTSETFACQWRFEITFKFNSNGSDRYELCWYAPLYEEYELATDRLNQRKFRIQRDGDETVNLYEYMSVVDGEEPWLDHYRVVVLRPLQVVLDYEWAQRGDHDVIAWIQPYSPMSIPDAFDNGTFTMKTEDVPVPAGWASADTSTDDGE